MALDAPSPRMQDTEGTIAECTAIEAALAELKAIYDQYFLGLERIPPLKRQEALKKRLMKLKNGFIKQAAAKFRVNALVSKFVTYERLWEKNVRARENGTYRPDLERARRKAQRQERASQGSGTRASERIEEDVDLDLDMDLDLDALASEAAESVPERAPVPLAPPAPPPVAKAPVAQPPKAAPIAAVENDEFDALLDALSEVRTPVPPAAVMTQVRSAASRVVSVPAMADAPRAEAPGSGAVQAAGSVGGPVTGGPPRLYPTPVPAAPVGTPGGPAGVGRPSQASPMGPPSQVPSPAMVRPSQVAPPATARPGTVPATAPRPATGSSPPVGGVSDAKLKAVYDAYVSAKQRCNEDTSGLNFDQVASKLRREVGQLTQVGGAKAVEFKVVIKDGRAELRTVPKD